MHCHGSIGGDPGKIESGEDPVLDGDILLTHTTTVLKFQSTKSYAFFLIWIKVHVQKNWLFREECKSKTSPSCDIPKI
jgi:hypothetical protein